MRELIEAANEFLKDERRRKRTRFIPLKQARLKWAIEALTPRMNTQKAHVQRGVALVELMGLDDDFEEMAIDAITDILWACHSHGSDSTHVLGQAGVYFSEERRDGFGPDVAAVNDNYTKPDIPTNDWSSLGRKALEGKLIEFGDHRSLEEVVQAYREYNEATERPDSFITWFSQGAGDPYNGLKQVTND